jgi:hypothetical protein
MPSLVPAAKTEKASTIDGCAMPTLHDLPPAAVQADIDALKAALDAAIPAKASDNLLIATWNIRAFASLTRKRIGETNGI